MTGDVVFGYVGDAHYNSVKATVNTRYYKDGLPKVREAVAVLNSRAGLDFVVLGGDMIDHEGNTTTLALADLGGMAEVVSDLGVPHCFALGNHDLDATTKAEYLSVVGQAASYAAFDAGTHRVIILDACFNTDSDADPYSGGATDWRKAFIPPAERAWLSAELSGTTRPVIVICHHRLAGPAQWSDYVVTNAPAVRSILEASGKVVAAFGGHNHINDSVSLNGIEYRTLAGITDFPYPHTAFGIVSLTGGVVSVEGRGRIPSV